MSCRSPRPATTTTNGTSARCNSRSSTAASGSWSAPGETVLSPFAGIGSEGVGALARGRRFVGVELKPSYFRVAAANLTKAEYESETPTLFADLDA